jgi:ABC-type glycerol-3-phosphate transport system permease component
VRPPEAASRRRSIPASTIAAYGVLLAYAAWSVFPVLWVALTSFKTNVQALAIPPQLVFTPTLANYGGAIDRVDDFPRVVFNSLFIAAGSTLVIVVLALPAAYGLSRFVHARRTAIGATILSARGFPTIAVAIPLFLLMLNANLLDTHVSVIAANVSFSLPFAIWMFYSFIQAVSFEIEEAALLDGASRLTVLVRIVFPIIIPGVAATAILVSIVAWREFLYPLVLTSREARTLPLVVGEFITAVGTDWGQLCAFAVMTIAPVAIFAVFSWKYLVRGFVGGGGVSG